MRSVEKSSLASTKIWAIQAFRETHARDEARISELLAGAGELAQERARAREISAHAAERSVEFDMLVQNKASLEAEVARRDERAKVGRRLAATYGLVVIAVGFAGSGFAGLLVGITTYISLLISMHYIGLRSNNDGSPGEDQRRERRVRFE